MPLHNKQYNFDKPLSYRRANNPSEQALPKLDILKQKDR